MRTVKTGGAFPQDTLVLDIVPGAAQDFKIARWSTAPPADPNRLRRFFNDRRGVVWLLLFCLTFAAFFWTGTTAFFALGLVVAFTLLPWPKSLTSLNHLMDLPAAVPQFPVEVELFVGGLKYAQDRGVVSFVGSWMHFQGLKSNFSLDVHLEPASGKRIQLQPPTSLHLDVDLGLGTMKLKVRPYDNIRGGGKGQIRAFFAAFHAANLVPPSKGVQVIPPLPSGNSASRLAKLTCIAATLFATLGLLVGPIAIAFLCHDLTASILYIASLFIGAVSFFTLKDVRSSIGNLERFERLSKKSDVTILEEIRANTPTRHHSITIGS